VSQGGKIQTYLVVSKTMIIGDLKEKSALVMIIFMQFSPNNSK
jgi:hypothetical protein